MQGFKSNKQLTSILVFELDKSGSKDWLVSTIAYLGGGALGVVVDKVVGDALIYSGIPNPQVSSVQAHDVALIAGELAGAYFIRNKSPIASKLLIGMASAVVITDVLEVVAPMIIFSASAKSSAFSNSRYARYDVAPAKKGAYL
jgi:hypothetical protein